MTLQNDLLRILVTTADDALAAQLSHAVVAMRRWRCEVDVVSGLEAASRALDLSCHDVVFVDDRKGESGTAEWIRRYLADSPTVPLIVLGDPSDTGGADGGPAGSGSEHARMERIDSSELRPASLERVIRYLIDRLRLDDERRSARVLFHAALDALDDHIAILDDSGIICETNAAWKAFGRAKRFASTPSGRGANYLEVCDVAAEKGDAAAAAAAAGMRAVLAGREPSFTLEAARYSPQGERWFRMRVTPFVESGQRRLLVVHSPISERVQAHRALKESLERYRLASLATSDVMFDWTIGTGAIYWAPTLETVFGHAETPEQGRIEWWLDNVHPDDRARVTEEVYGPLGDATSMWEMEYRFRRAEGTYALVRDRCVVLRTEDGTPVRVIGSMSDITSQRRASEQIRFQALLLDSVAEAVAATDANGAVVYWNDSAERLFGWRADEAMRLPLAHLLGDEPECLTPARARDTHCKWAGECTLRRRDGSTLPVFLTAAPVTTGAGDSIGMVFTMLDLTEQRTATLERERLIAQLGQERTRLGTLLEQAPAFIAAVRGPGHVFELANEMYYQFVGRREILGKRAVEVLPELEAQGFISLLDQVLSTGTPFVGAETPVHLARGPEAQMEERYVNFVFQPIVEADGSRSGVFVLGVDVSAQVQTALERERLLTELDEERRRLAAVIRNMPFGVLLAEAPSGRLVLGNVQLEKVLGSPFRPVDSIGAYASIVGYREDGTLVLPHEWPLARALLHGESVLGEVYRFQRDGDVNSWMRVNASPIRDRSGEIAAALVTVEDVTAQVETERALQRSENQLRQAQKMEAVGRLAGGVAHDFNNLLGVIMSYSGMLLQELRVDDPVHGDIQEIQNAVERAAELTRQLLAFSRQQVLQLSVIDLRDIVRSTERMLRRLIGEDVTLETELTDEPCLVLADAGQLEQVVVNVVLNARDAMPTGGTLRLSVSRQAVSEAAALTLGEVTPGSYAVLAVRDTGEGMDAATKARIFDPFFTTKEVGKGTGLGLATVYGIVSQSGGYITVDSERGMGSTFSIFLPSTDEVQLHTDGSRHLTGQGNGDGTTVLLVEDEPALRKITERVLVKHGFRVLSAADGAEAMSLAATTEPIHCVLSDVVMPTMSGQQLLARLEELRGPLPAIFMSGYAIEAVEKHGVLRSGTPLLRKPVKPAELVEAVSRAIARRADITERA